VRTASLAAGYFSALSSIMDAAPSAGRDDSA
jgi:hypothetical protein